HRADKLDALGSVRFTGAVHMANQGMRGRFDSVCASDGRFRMSIDYGLFGDLHSGFDGSATWSASAYSPFEEATGDEAAAVRLQHPLAVLQPWHQYEEAAVHPSMELDGRNVHRVELKQGKVTRRLAIDAESGLLVQES